MTEAFLMPAACVVVVASAVGIIVSAIARDVTAAIAAADEQARVEEAEVLERALASDPLVLAITGEIEIVRVCPHLGYLDRVNGLTCPCVA